MRLNSILTPYQESLSYKIEDSEDFVEIYCGDRRVAVFGTHGAPELMREAVEENIRERDLVDGSRGRNLSGY